MGHNKITYGGSAERDEKKSEVPVLDIPVFRSWEEEECPEKASKKEQPGK
jgi:hypothetical protein